MKDSFYQLSTEVQNALEARLPIVALESTFISHGLPYPDNLSTIKCMMENIYGQKAVPAVIGLVDGQVKIGLSHEEIAFFAKNKDSIRKVNRADLSFCLAQKKYGATTVSATAFCAANSGIRVFATGGIGGVHRGAEASFDISSDLSELSKSSILVVCAGAKSLLDIPKTLESLETLSVPILGYKTNNFPLFYSTKSPYLLKQTVSSAMDAAKIALIHFAMQSSSIILAQPIPEDAALDAGMVEDAIIEATTDCQRMGIRDKEVTPYILERLSKLTNGQTLVANKSLLINNAKLAAEIAFALSKIDR